MLKHLSRFGFSQQLLFTPGPLLTTQSVKSSMLVDMGSRDPKFIKIIESIRSGLLNLAESDPAKYTSVLIQGSGTYAIESTLQTTVRQKQDKVLVAINGSYGDRQAQILSRTHRNFVRMDFEDNQKVNAQQVLERLRADPTITHVSMVHSETTSGVINDIDFLQNADVGRKVIFIVDAMSSFGAYRIPAERLNIDFLISSSNKCLQGAPGFAFVISNKNILDKCIGNADSLVLDLQDQDEQMNKTKQFRFTPPTHVLVAFAQALQEHAAEGGVDGRYAKYRANQQLLVKTMRQMGFKTYIKDEDQGCIITTFVEPVHKNYNFKEFYDFLAARNYVIYPGKKTKLDTFRIGSIGELTQDNMKGLLKAIEEYLKTKQIPLPVPY